MGGDEFCVLASPEHGDVDMVLADAAEALSEHGDGFTITCSYGKVMLPTEAAGAEHALHVADQRMYLQKNGGRVSAGRQSSDVLLRALSERHPSLGDHVHGVAELAVAIGERLGLLPEELEDLRQAAELHDMGKVAIPDAILDKPGPLDDDEWEFMRRHTIIGERILQAAPALERVATIVRSTHERMDGKGYPDRLAGEAIPLAARIVLVCDAFEAMTADRSYRKAMSAEVAIEELERCAGAQFDPRVVTAFRALADQRAAARAAAASSRGAAGVAARDDLERRARVPAALEERGEDLGRLRAGGAEAAVDHEARDGADAERGGGLLVLAHLRGEAVGRQRLAHLVRVQADLGGEPHQRVVVGDQLTLGVVGAHHALLHLRPGRPCRRGELEQPVAVERVGRRGSGRRACRGRPRRPCPPSGPARARASSTLIPYFSARCSAPECSRAAGAPGSSSKLRQVTRTSSRCSKAASAASKRRLPT